MNDKFHYFPKYNLSVFYKYNKALSNNQRNFIENICENFINSNNSNNNNINLKLLEFPQTLDKDFLCNSTIYSLSLKYKFKFILVTKNYDTIFNLLKNFDLIKSKFNSNKNKERLDGVEGEEKEERALNVIPFFDRKFLCINDKALETASSNDFDMFCTKITASWVSENDKCVYFKVRIKFKFQNFLKSLEKPIKIEYDSNNVEMDTNNINNNNYKDNNDNNKDDFINFINKLESDKVCPYYYLFNQLKHLEKNDILLVTFKDFVDLKNRKTLINSISNLKEYFIVFDECNNIDKISTELFSMNIDDKIFVNAMNQIFVLRENLKNSNNIIEYKESYNILSQGFDFSSNNSNDEYQINKQYFNTEKEFLWNNGFALACDGKFIKLKLKLNF